MRSNKQNIYEQLNKWWGNPNQEINIEILKQLPKARIDNFMKESGLSYFEVFIESELADIMDEVEADNIRLVRVKHGTKIPQDTNY